MQALQKIPEQLGKLPIPPASLVIDTRGVQDDLLETLWIEFENFAGDTLLSSISHWRYFTSFIQYKKIQPFGSKESEALLLPDKSTNLQAINSASGANPAPQTITGRSDPNPVLTYNSPPYFQEEIQNPPLGNIHNDAFKRKVEECIEEIDALRNKRINATADVGKTGDFGRHIKDSMVRVMFLTDARRPDSLSTAAAYAEYLKRYYGKLEHSDHPLTLNTTIVCLNHTNWGSAPETLINRLSRKVEDNEWEHINALILSEEYRQDAGRLKEDMQKYISELLLYILLLVPPSAVRTESPDMDEIFPNPDPNAMRKRGLPPHSYIVGISAIEHSVRWGRRYLNFGLAEQTLDTLRNVPPDSEQNRNVSAARSWLDEWCSDVRREVPDSIPGDIPALDAFTQAKIVSTRPMEQIFHTNGLRLLRKDTTPADIEQYTLDLACNVVMFPAEQSKKRNETLGSSHALLSEAQSFQNTLDSLPQIQQNVVAARTKTRGPLSPFVEAIHKAQRVLSDQRFFLGANGAIERGRRQLKELHTVINELQDDHEVGIDSQQMRNELEALSKRKVGELAEYSNSFPLIGSVPALRTIMALLSLLLAILLGITLEVGIFAWLREIVLAIFPSSLVPLDFTILNFSLFTLLLLVFLIITVIIILLNFGRYILSRKRTVRRIEMTCWSLLLAFALLGLFISLTRQWIVDPVSLNVLAPLGSLPLLSSLAFFFVLVMLFVEGFYFLSWSRRLKQKRRNIIIELRQQHLTIQREVEQYIATTIALDLLKEAGLTDGNRGEGLYYQNMTALNRSIDSVQAVAQSQFQQAEKSLIIRQNATANPGSSALLVRAEQLDVNRLMGNYKLLSDSLTKNREEVNELAEAVLRAMGTESAATIEQDLRDRTPTAQSTNRPVRPDRRERHNAEALMTTSVSMITRFATSTSSYEDAKTLEQRYLALDHRIVPEFSTLKPVIDQLLTKGQAIKQDAFISPEEWAGAFASWGQILWERKVPELNELLNSEGAMAKLQEEHYNPQTVRDTLEILANLVGRPVMAGQISERFLLMFPSAEGRQFFQNQRMEPHYIDFPDVERLVLLYIQHYVAKPTFTLLPRLPTPYNNNANVLDSSLQNVQPESSSSNATMDDDLNNSSGNSTIL